MKKTGKVICGMILAAVVLLASSVPAHAIASAVILNHEKLTMYPGQKITLEMLVRNYPTAPEKWSTSKKSVATVSKNGVVTAKKKGTAKIKCKTGFGYSLTCKITVKDRLEISKYLNKKYTKLAKKVKTAAFTTNDPLAANNLYVFEDNSLFFRFNTKTKKIDVLQNAYDNGLSLYGVTLGMQPKKAKKALLKAGFKYKGKSVAPAVTDYKFKKSGHVITVKVRDGLVDCVQWNR